MDFHIKRFLYGLAKRRIWLLFIVIMPLLYVIVAAIHFDRFTITQDISIMKDTPFSLSSAITGGTTIDALLMNPDMFFLNNYAVRQLYTNLYAGTAVYRADRQFRTLLDTVRTTMTLTMPAEDRAQIKYYGPEESMGRMLVTYYAQRMISKSNEGIARSRMLLTKDQVPTLAGDFVVERHRTIWRVERTLPFMLISIFSAIIVLAFLGILEWTDASFKSERQVAQYTELPIVGSLPNLNKLSAVLGPQS